MFLVKTKFLYFSIQLFCSCAEDITAYLDNQLILKNWMAILDLERYVKQMPAKARATSNHSHENNLQKFLFAENLVYTKFCVQWCRINTTFFIFFSEN